MIRVAIFEDNRSMRESLSSLVRSSSSLFLTGAYASAIDAVKLVGNDKPDVILMDIQMPTVSGLEAIRLVKQKFPSVQVLMQTVFDDNDKIFAAICLGASGYVLKNLPAQEMLNAITEVYEGRSVMSPSIARKTMDMFRQQNKVAITMQAELTTREKEILCCLVKGMSYKLIADACGVSYTTVNSHIKNIYEKLHVNSASEAVAKALLQKMV